MLSYSDSEEENLDFDSSDEDTDSSLADGSDWTDNADMKPPFPFTGKPGLKNEPNFENELDAFRYFLTDDLINLIIEETNRYGSDSKVEASGNSRAVKWESISQDELFSFLGLCFLMGIVKKPSIPDYWSEEVILSTPIFSKVMSRNRFQLILTNLHFSNNATADKTDKLHKIRQVIEQILARFQTYEPDQTLSVDEILQKFKGRLHWKQYIPSKRARYGMKIFCVCESSTSFVYNLIVYTGKDTLSSFSPSDLDGRVYLPHHLNYFATKLVLSLVAGLKGKGYTIVVDNFFTSLELTKRCIECCFDIFGTVNKCRKDLPKPFFSSSVEKGDLISSSITKDGHSITLFRYSDPTKKTKKTVNLISTIHDSSVVERSSRGTEGLSVPQVIADYNVTMGGVDKLSQVIDPYTVVRKSMKWYKKIFFMLLDFLVHNAFVVFSKSHKVSKKQFLQNLINQLLHSSSLNRSSKSVKVKGDTPVRLQCRDAHFLQLFPSQKENKATFRRCVVCTSRKLRKDTKYCCQKCGFTPLCAAPCFEIYHTKTCYSL